MEGFCLVVGVQNKATLASFPEEKSCCPAKHKNNNFAERKTKFGDRPDVVNKNMSLT